MSPADTLGVFPEPTLREAMASLWVAAATAEPRPWTALDIAVAEQETPDPGEPDVATLDRRAEDRIEAVFG